MSTAWILNAVSTNGAQVTTSSAVPATGNKYRLRTLCVTLSGDGTTVPGPIEFVVRDGPTGTGSIIWNGFLSAPAIGTSNITQDYMDIRTANQITIESTSGASGNARLSVHGSGDIIIVGYPCYGVENFS